MLQGVSPLAAVIFSGFEFVFYGAFILTVATLLRQGWELLRPRGRNDASAS
jgi:hypothetical protein